MKPVKYAFVLLFLCSLCCFSTATEALEEQVYTLRARFIGVNKDEDGVLGMNVELFQDRKMDNLELWFERSCRFIAPPAPGLLPEQIVFAEFAERFAGQAINIDFVIREGVYRVIECRLLTP